MHLPSSKVETFTAYAARLPIGTPPTMITLASLQLSCSDTVEAAGLKWAYRKSTADDSAAKKPAILLLHGIGSNSYCYRDLMRLLSLGGHDCYAPDWPGHGATDKVSSTRSYEMGTWFSSQSSALLGSKYTVCAANVRFCI
jgi:predicted alpha/beta-fold hydrolase